MKQSFFRPAQVFCEYFKIQTIIFNSIQLEFEVLNNYRQLYNPSQFSLQIEKAYKNNNLVKLINAISLYSFHAFLFYFFPFWIVSFPFYLFKNLKIWRLAWLKISFSISEYKFLTKTALVTNFKGIFNLQIIISFFPFVFGISYIIYSRYQHQVFSYFIHKNLPGVYPCLPRLKWDTFQNITSQHLNTKSIYLTKDLSNKTILSSNEIAQVGTLSKNKNTLTSTLTQSDNKILNFNTDLDSQISSGQANNFQSPITSAFKVNKFIKQLDFYNDSFLIKLKSNWLNKKKQQYIGLFPKEKFLHNSLVSPNPLLTPLNSWQIGNNWHLISPKDFITFSLILPTKLFREDISVVETGDWTRPKNYHQTLKLNQNLSKNSFFLVNQRQFLSDNSSSSQTEVAQAKYSIGNYWDVFLLNLDELPKKLNSRTLPTLTSTVSNENAPQPIQLLLLKKEFYEDPDFLLNTVARNRKSPNQMTTVKVFNPEVVNQFNSEYQEDRTTKKSSLLKDGNVNATSINTLANFTRSFEFFSKKTSYASENIKFKYTNIKNLFDLRLDPEKQVCSTKESNLKKIDQLANNGGSKVHLHSTTNSSIKTLDGFSNNYPVRESKEISLGSESFFLNKFNLFPTISIFFL